jgi:hypothetical protein
LPAAAGRAALPTTAEVTGLRRYPAEVEAAVYFCCLEALQNAGKHAGDGAKAKLRVWEDEGVLHFEVSDNGVGFTPSADASGSLGHGFVNMADRLGAIDRGVGHRQFHLTHVGPGATPAAGRKTKRGCSKEHRGAEKARFTRHAGVPPCRTSMRIRACS